MARKNLKDVQPIEITLKHDVLMASSLQVAKHFNKQHNNVLRDIRELISKAPVEWASANFEPTEESVVVSASGGIRKDPTFMMTRNGFTMLAMGFTGKKAFEWKLKYLTAFNEMEAEIQRKLIQPNKIPESLDRLREIITPPEDEDLETRRIRMIKSIRGYIVSWAYIDEIPLDTAEMCLCAYLNISNLEDFEIEQYSSALKFLQNNTQSLRKKGEAASREQLDMIELLIEACQQFKYFRDCNPLDYFAYPDTLRSDEPLTKQDATKIINHFQRLLYEFERVTVVINRLYKVFETK